MRITSECTVMLRDCKVLHLYLWTGRFASEDFVGGKCVEPHRNLDAVTVTAP